MKASVAVLLALGTSGCGFLRERGEDFLDVWRADLHVAAIPGGWVHAGPLVHTGLGMTRFCTHGVVPGIGHIYNRKEADEAACGDMYFIIHGREAKPDEGTGKHLCFGILPGVLHLHGQDRPLIHLFDLEVGVGFGFGGFDLGFSPGQFLDFLLGWFGLDLAGDDPVQERVLRSGEQSRPPPGPPPLPGGFRHGDAVELGLPKTTSWPASKVA